MRARLAVGGLDNPVVSLCDATTCVVRSGRGGQFRSRKFIQALRYLNLAAPIGPVGAAGEPRGHGIALRLAVEKGRSEANMWAPANS